MSTRWYLVKRNWLETAQRRPGFAGVGGDVWPLDGVDNDKAREVHRLLMASREHVRVGQKVEYLCLDRARAEVYCSEVERHGGGAWLLEISPGEDSTGAVNGFDIGFPSGGGSLVESELITQARRGPPLNEWGLLTSKEDALSYIASRWGDDTLEDAADTELLAVSVIRRG